MPGLRPLRRSRFSILARGGRRRRRKPSSFYLRAHLAPVGGTRGATQENKYTSCSRLEQGGRDNASCHFRNGEKTISVSSCLSTTIVDIAGPCFSPTSQAGFPTVSSCLFALSCKTTMTSRSESESASPPAREPKILICSRPMMQGIAF